MSLKSSIRKLINALLERLIRNRPQSLWFIPNGRFPELDIIRSGVSIHTIFDVGANIGQTALNYHKFFPTAVIHSFEPVSSTYEILKKNTMGIKNISPVNIALGMEKGKMLIALEENNEINSLKNLAHINDISAEEIQINSGLNYCKNEKVTQIDLLKIDTEGYELDVLKGFDISFLSENVKFIYCEVGFNKDDIYKTHFSDLESYLKEVGFVTSWFYEPARWGKSRLILGFCNVLFSNLKAIN